MPTKRNLLFCFYLRKSATESQRMLSKAYDDYTPSISIGEYWFRCYKSDFDIEDEERPGQPKKFEEEVEALFDQDSSQILASLNVDRSTISRRFEDHWNDSKARKLGAVRVEAEERRKAQNEKCCFKNTEEKVFCIVS